MYYIHAQSVLTITQDFATKLFEIIKIFITLSKPFKIFLDLFQICFKFTIEKSITHVDDFTMNFLISIFVAKSITSRKLLILENYIMEKK